MTFDESDGKITNELCGRTIKYVTRNGKLLELHTECGHIVKLQSDVKHDIHYRGTGVQIMLDPLAIGAEQGMR